MERRNSDKVFRTIMYICYNFYVNCDKISSNNLENLLSEQILVLCTEEFKNFQKLHFSLNMQSF